MKRSEIQVAPGTMETRCYEPPRRENPTGRKRVAAFLDSLILPSRFIAQRSIPISLQLIGCFRLFLMSGFLIDQPVQYTLSFPPMAIS